MNILDIERTEDNSNLFEGDKLDQIFEGQRFLMKNYKEIAEKHYQKIFKVPVKISDEAWSGGESNLHTKEGNFLIKDMLDATIQELSESIQTLKNWKAWKQTEIPSDTDHFKEELIDALHFYIEAAILSGITSEELHSLYFKKHAVNQFRQRTNY